jgi:hypothetical protein
MKTFLLIIVLFIACQSSLAIDTLYLVSGEPYQFDENIEYYKKRPVLFFYDPMTRDMDTIVNFNASNQFLHLRFIGLYNALDHLTILGQYSYGKRGRETLLLIMDLKTNCRDSILLKSGVLSESNLFALSPDSIYYCVTPTDTEKERGFSRGKDSKDFFPGDYNYAYIQGEVGAPINNREFLLLYNEKTDNNALHISKGAGYGLKVGPYLKLQPPQELYNAYSSALKTIRVNDLHSMIIHYNSSKPQGDRLGELYLLVYNKMSKEWYNQTLRGNMSSVRSYDNGWVAGTIRDIDKGRYYDRNTATYGESYDFKREIPGYEDRDPILYDWPTGIWGDCFDERAQNFRTYYSGLLYLFNVHTKDYIEWDTKQGDSEVLLVQDGMVYYRINTKILKSAIVGNKELGTSELLIDDVRVRDIHWAYLKKNKK